MTEHPTRLSDVTTVLLDVNETLTDLGPLEAWMREQGLGPGSASAWLASVLRDGRAASLAGVPARFGPLGRRALRDLLEAYLGACDRLGTTPERTALIACHPWDVLGAQRAGLVAVWVPRGRSWPESYPAAQRTAARLTEVLEAL